MKKIKVRKKVICAMSGGIDSSVAAALLKRADFDPHTKRGQGVRGTKIGKASPHYGVGVDVIGVFMKFWSEPGENGLIGVSNRCCSPEAEIRARKVAKILKIPFYVFNFEKEFKKKIVDNFLKEYKKGKTPNPCVICNKEIKFGLLLEKALSLGADFIATGHYARLRREIPNSKSQVPNYRLLRAKDKEKDQSYFLWQLNQKQLKHILFPVGGYMKTEVRRLARKFKLPVFDAPESQEICFIPNANLNEFLKSRIKNNKGKIFDPKRKIIGEHQGLWFYTIGQRKGIGLAGGPYFVLDKDLKKNLLIVTKNKKDLLKKELLLKNVNWISGKSPKPPLKIRAKIRYRHQPASAVITKNNPGTYTLKFKKLQRAITPGQSVVFYRGQELLGGGIIC